MALTHRECTASFREDRRLGLIYGPYAESTGQYHTCSVCHGSGSYAKYADDPINGDKAGRPAPCEYCQGTGQREILRVLTMDQWAAKTGLCVYCNTPRKQHGRTV